MACERLRHTQPLGTVEAVPFLFNGKESCKRRESRAKYAIVFKNLKNPARSKKCVLHRSLTWLDFLSKVGGILSQDTHHNLHKRRVSHGEQRRSVLETIQVVKSNSNDKKA